MYLIIFVKSSKKPMLWVLIGFYEKKKQNYPLIPIEYAPYLFFCMDMDAIKLQNIFYYIAFFIKELSFFTIFNTEYNIQKKHNYRSIQALKL